MHDVFDLKADYANPRVATTKNFLTETGGIILDEMRTDCPETLPKVPAFDEKNPMYNKYND